MSEGALDSSDNAHICFLSGVCIGLSHTMSLREATTFSEEYGRLTKSQPIRLLFLRLWGVKGDIKVRVFKGGIKEE